MSTSNVCRTTVLVLCFLFFLLLHTPAAVAESARAGIELARGIVLINAGHYREALEPLARALADEPRDQEALYYAGLAHSRLGEYDAAADLLTRALAIDESADVAFELGRVRALTAHCDEARRLFARYEALGADEAGRRSVEGLLLDCGGDREGLPLQLAVTVGWQHDSNVILESESTATPEPVKADGRAVLYLTAGGVPLRTRLLELDFGGSFYGSRHDELHDYDALVGRLSTELALTSWQRVRPALGYGYEYSYFGGNSYNRTHRGTFQVEVREGSRAATEVVLEARDAHFWDSELFSDNAERTGAGESAGLRQRITVGMVETAISLFGDWDRAREEWWASEGWRAAVRVSWQMTRNLAVKLSGEYQARDYDAPFPGQEAAREDRTSTWGAMMSRSLGRTATLTLSGTRTSNESNLDHFEYTRTIIGLYLTFGLGG